MIEEPLHRPCITSLGHQVQPSGARSAGMDHAGVVAQEPGGGIPFSQREGGEEIHTAAGPEQLHHRPVDVRRHRIRRRRKTRTIRRLRIGPQLEQECDHRGAIHPDRKVQRPLKALVVTQRLCQRRRVGRDDAANFVLEPHRDGGEDVMPRAATDQKIRDGAMNGVVASVPACRPADDLEGVIVTVPDYITAGIGQLADDFQVTSRRRPVHRVGVVPLLARIHVQAAFQQQVHRGQLPGERREVQERVLVGLVADLQLVRIFVEEGTQGSDVALACRLEQSAVDGGRLGGLFRHSHLPPRVWRGGGSDKGRLPPEYFASIG